MCCFEMARLFRAAGELILLVVFTVAWRSRAATTELLGGFRATPDPSVTDFQPLLVDSSGNFSLGFLRVNGSHLSLSVVHVPSSVTLWSAGATRLARWKNPTELLFNGSLVLSDSKTGVFWSTHSSGDRVWLSNNSNLEIQSRDGAGAADGTRTVWQSFDFPSDTLVVNQNFTNTTALTSSNGLYSMRLGQNFFGLYAKFTSSDEPPDQIYLRHGALEAKAEIIEGRPVQLILQPGGYLGMYQNGSLPADVLPFDTFQQNLTGFRRVRIEPDGNLKAYYWTGSNWILDYQAITDFCELPTACGPYGLCKPDNECSCLDNRTAHRDPGGCAPSRNQISGDFCGAYDGRFKVLRRTGVELPFKELMKYKTMSSNEECEMECSRNCSCWGAVYSNSSGFCYTLEFPAQTLLAVADGGKMGYFKVREGARKKEVGGWLGLVIGAILVFGVIAGVVWYRWKKRRDRVKGCVAEEGVVGNIGPYKDLGAASFRSIELCER
ncbi:PAN domain-containing protein At5g03700 [Andrographis paniculata]|uniref:PAN domain-containing protein At5g03700 n=1 Tax=Andrographis paniculata TaxID=175694 RepID=UPI0021E6F4BB|nr:PAN domain-containing protein At5g03700 [Andrographis paniculata]